MVYDCSLHIFLRAQYSFSDLLTDGSSILPHAAHERDPTVDYRSNAAVLNTMATCHSLKVVDGELIGDPLDVKMFEFTEWSYEEGNHDAIEVDDQPELFSPSIARAPPTFASGNSGEGVVCIFF